jgi:hypothetical protein
LEEKTSTLARKRMCPQVKEESMTGEMRISRGEMNRLRRLGDEIMATSSSQQLITGEEREFGSEVKLISTSTEDFWPDLQGVDSSSRPFLRACCILIPSGFNDRIDGLIVNLANHRLMHSIH